MWLLCGLTGLCKLGNVRASIMVEVDGMVARKKTAHFEKSLEALESVVDDMESGELSLDDALKAFEKGVKLTQECQQALDEAEQKVSILLGDSPAAEPVPFDAGPADA
ncbi:exodeoxyribonuclease VII small subunit [Marinagarivorans cellulosilyticus]